MIIKKCYSCRIKRFRYFIWINPNYFKDIINKLNISTPSKDILKKIFSQNDKKDYIDIVLDDLKANEHVKYDNKFGSIIRIIFK